MRCPESPKFGKDEEGSPGKQLQNENQQDTVLELLD